jgi:hypothetical protein
MRHRVQNLKGGGVRIPMWLLFHSYPVILLASVLLLLTAITRQD